MPFIKNIIVWILTLESRLILAKYKPFVIAVTGSVGKTSTKDAIYCVFESQGGYVRKSEKSLNSEIGLPLTVIGVPNAWHSLSGWWSNILKGLELIISRREYPTRLILEIGADHPGDIKKVAKWLHPDITVLTKVSRTPVHVEFFGSPEEVFEEKAALARAVKRGGTAVLPSDDERMISLGTELKEKGIEVISFGISAQSTVRGGEQSVVYQGENGEPIGMTFKLDIDGNSVPVMVEDILGPTYMYPLLSAVATAKAAGISIHSIVEALKRYTAPPGRMNILKGINSSILIDDSYNSSPDAVESALEALKVLECKGRKIAVLGDMMELGKYASEEHRKAGKEAAEIVQILITVGQRSRSTADEAVQSGLTAKSVHSFDSSVEAAAYLTEIVQSGDVILIKGSQSMRLERITKALLRQPEKAGELLVRQEKEWLEKP